MNGTAVLNPVGHSREGVSGESSIPITAAAKSVVSGSTTVSPPALGSASALKAVGVPGSEGNADSGESSHVLSACVFSIEGIGGVIGESDGGTKLCTRWTGLVGGGVNKTKGVAGLGE